MGRRLALVLCLVAPFAAPAQAHAAVPLTRCGQTAGLQCATVDVPLDRSGAVPGTISLHVEVLPATGFQRGVMFLIAGGPGQGSAQTFNLGAPDSAEFMQAIFPGYTLVAFDNRGTGRSGVLRCPTLQTTTEGSAEDFAALARDCASSIGTQRQFYATRDHAEDMESVRQALGYGPVALYGVSYGTKLALAYALAHPASVNRMVLDSVVPPQFPDPFDTNVLRQMPATLRSFCAGGVCTGATSDFAGDVATLANRLEDKPISGKVLIPGGGSKTAHMNGEDLLGLIIDADLSPGLAAELPAAVHAALQGQTRPLLRLLDLDKRTSVFSAEDISFGLNAATNCADGQFPWTPDTPAGARRAVIDAALNALPPGSFGPLGKWAARIGTAFFCEQWPTPTGRTPLGAGPYPNVPVFVVSGGFDLRTPTDSAAAIAAQFPQGHLLVVPGVGHSVLTADLSFCSQRAVRDWIQSGTTPPASCPRVPSWVKVLGAFPAQSVRRAPSSTMAVVGKAVRDAEATWLEAVFSTESINPAGIYGGKLVVGGGVTFGLKSYSATPGVALTGNLTAETSKLPFTFSGSLRISGKSAATGTLRVRGNTLSGTLGGRRVSGKF